MMEYIVLYGSIIVNNIYMCNLIFFFPTQYVFTCLLSYMLVCWCYFCILGDGSNDFSIYFGGISENNLRKKG